MQFSFRAVTPLETGYRRLYEQWAPAIAPFVASRMTEVLGQGLSRGHSFCFAAHLGDRPKALIYGVEADDAIPIRLGPISLPFLGRIAVAGHPLLTLDCGLIAEPVADRDTLHRKVLSALPAFFANRGIDVLILKDCAIASTTLLDAGFIQIPSEPAMALDVRWNNEEEYRADLRRKYRRKLERAERELTRQGWTLRFDLNRLDASSLYTCYSRIASAVPEPPKGYRRRIVHAITNLPRRFDVSRLDIACIDHMLDRHRDDIDLVRLTDHDATVAFVMCCTKKGETHAFLAGSSLGRFDPWSYRVLLAGAIRCAIDRGSDKVVFGRTGLTTKAELGASPSPLHSYATVVNPSLRALNVLGRMIATHLRGVRAPIRHVFRTDNSFPLPAWYQGHWAEFYARRRVVDFYDANRNLMDLVKGGRARFHATCVDAVRPYLDGSIVDLCCGTGELTRAIATAMSGSGRVIGLDLSPEMLERAQEKSSDLPTIFRRGDASSTRFEAGRFDAALIVATLHEMPRIERYRVLRETHRILRPDGLIVVGEHRVAQGRLAALVHKLIFGAIATEAERATFADLIQNSLRGELEDCGFQPIAEQVMRGGLFRLVLARPGRNTRSTSAGPESWPEH